MVSCIKQRNVVRGVPSIQNAAALRLMTSATAACSNTSSSATSSSITPLAGVIKSTERKQCNHFFIFA